MTRTDINKHFTELYQLYDSNIMVKSDLIFLQGRINVFLDNENKMSDDEIEYYYALNIRSVIYNYIYINIDINFLKRFVNTLENLIGEYLPIENYEICYNLNGLVKSIKKDIVSSI
jgi:hypothetical protein